MTKAKLPATDPDQLTIDQVAQKHKVETVYQLKIPVNDEGTEHAIGYIKKPSRQILGAALSVMNTNPLKANQIILESCWLEGDQRILKDDDLFMSAGALLGEIVKVRQGEIKKNSTSGR